MGYWDENAADEWNDQISAQRVNMNVDRLLRQRDRLDRRIERLMDMPSEPDADPALIYFTKTFDNGIDYTYAAVKAGDGRWYTTGPRTPKGYYWADLIQWIVGDKDPKEVEVWVVTELDRL